MNQRIEKKNEYKYKIYNQIYYAMKDRKFLKKILVKILPFEIGRIIMSFIGMNEIKWNSRCLSYKIDKRFIYLYTREVKK